MVDVMLSGGGEVTPDHREINPETGQQKGYLVLTPEERAKGFVRPVRRSYIHIGRLTFPDDSDSASRNGCGVSTRMSQDIAETYARSPSFYSGTFCSHCQKHFPLDEFVWLDNPDQQVGS